MRVLAVIPARYSSTRLPGKPLSLIHGKPMVQWVYEQAMRASGLDAVVVATDDERVAEAVRRFGGGVLMTPSNLQSGTDRVAAIAERMQADVYVNIQGDEPLIEPETIQGVVEQVASGQFEMGTAMTPMTELADLKNPSVVKVVTDQLGRALYFSRFPIPYSRADFSSPSIQGLCSFACRRHLGIYAYTRKTLFLLRSLPPSALEKAEGLEQLRALEVGIAIGVAEVFSISRSVDTPEDLEKIREMKMRQQQQEARKDG